MRLRVYLEWLQVARSLVGPPGPVLPGSVLEMPTPAVKARLNGITTELDLVASYRVRAAVAAYIKHIDHPSVKESLGRPARSMDEMIDRFQETMKDQRRNVVKAMRQDLGSGRTSGRRGRALDAGVDEA